MGLPATSVTVKSPPQLKTVQLTTPSVSTSTPKFPSTTPSPASTSSSGAGVIAGAMVATLVGVGGLIGLLYWLLVIKPKTGVVVVKTNIPVIVRAPVPLQHNQPYDSRSPSANLGFPPPMLSPTGYQAQFCILLLSDFVSHWAIELAII